MEAAIIGVIGRIAPLLFGFLHNKRKLLKELEGDIRSIEHEFNYIYAAIADAGDHPLRNGDKVYKTWIHMVRDLARDIEDCIDHFTHHRAHKISTAPTRLDFAKEIQKLKERSVEASQQIERYNTKKKSVEAGERYSTGGGSGSITLELGTPEAGTLDTAAPVGMDAARRELMELINETPQDQPKKLKVISIVGFGGIGKSQLADFAYSTFDESEYPEKAWVHAAGKRTGHLLKEIHQQLRKNSTTSSSSGEPHPEDDSYNLRKLRTRVHQYLEKKRFFIVIDGMWESCWDDIKDAFPVVSEVSSRVIVTTDKRSIATKCSSANGHVYVMRTLDEEHSRQLLFMKASMEYPPVPDDTHLCSEAIKKCDGLPLALVTTARLLEGDHGPPIRKKCADVGKNLGQYLDKKELESMRRVLVRSYNSLGSQDVKNLLLYLGIYPNGVPIRRGSLIRRWLAEGLMVTEEDETRSALEVAVSNFDDLVDRSIIQPIDNSSSKSAVVKTCQTHGMMLEFILRKSMCQEFVTLLHDKDPEPSSKIRWLAMQHNTWSKIDPGDLPLVRSLTIFGEAHNSFLDFSKYKLMKVLDLEECRVEMRASHLKDICRNLVLLRYLSLGPGVKATVLPKEIKKLMLLETLDVRRTKIEILPAQAMVLPCLVHLFGKLKLKETRGLSSFLKIKGVRTLSELQTWLSENSKLETLAGFVVDESQQMPQLIEHMKQLTKVKIWCESTPSRHSGQCSFTKTIKGFIQRGTREDNALSLSLNFTTEWHKELLDFELKKDRRYYLRSLKLQGSKICSTLPLFLTMLGGLTKLCLSFPGHKLSSEFLAAVIKVPRLEYLKLVATQLENLVIRKCALGSLRRLCVVVEDLIGLEVQDGALPRLESLWLLCKDLNGFSGCSKKKNGFNGTIIHSLPLLKEVSLHDGLSYQAKQNWIKEAKDHRRRPKVSFAETKLMRSEPAMEIIFVAPATDTTAEGVAMLANAIPTEESVPDVTSENASEPATATDGVLSMNHSAIPNAQKENHGDGQHDGREKKYTDNSYGSNEFSTETGSSTSAESSEGEMLGGKDQRMEDDTQVPPKKDDTQSNLFTISKCILALHKMKVFSREDIVKA